MRSLSAFAATADKFTTAGINTNVLLNTLASILHRIGITTLQNFIDSSIALFLYTFISQLSRRKLYELFWSQLTANDPFAEFL